MNRGVFDVEPELIDISDDNKCECNPGCSYLDSHHLNCCSMAWNSFENMPRRTNDNKRNVEVDDNTKENSQNHQDIKASIDVLQSNVPSKKIRSKRKRKDEEVQDKEDTQNVKAKVKRQKCETKDELTALKKKALEETKQKVAADRIKKKQEQLLKKQEQEARKLQRIKEQEERRIRKYLENKAREKKKEERERLWLLKKEEARKQKQIKQEQKEERKRFNQMIIDNQLEEERRKAEIESLQKKAEEERRIEEIDFLQKKSEEERRIEEIDSLQKKAEEENEIYLKAKSNWAEYKASDGRTYFYNHITKQSSWTNPGEMKSQSELLLSHCPWKEYKSETTGRTYYHNIQTDESKWTIPKELETLKIVMVAKEDSYGSKIWRVASAPTSATASTSKIPSPAVAPPLSDGSQSFNNIQLLLTGGPAGQNDAVRTLLDQGDAADKEDANEEKIDPPKPLVFIDENQANDLRCKDLLKKNYIPGNVAADYHPLVTNDVVNSKPLFYNAPEIGSEPEDDYQTLAALADLDLVPNAEPFKCPICIINVARGEGVVLHDCLHSFCKDCLAAQIEHSERALIKCPFQNIEYVCESHLQDREIKSLVTPEVYERHLRQSAGFHCQTPDCTGWYIYEDFVNIFVCPVCKRTNCLTCAAIHEGMTCQQYQGHLAFRSDMNEKKIEGSLQKSELPISEGINTEETPDYPAILLAHDASLVPNVECFECPVCFLNVDRGEGVVLHDCLHNFCKECLIGMIQHSETATVKCPFQNDEYSCESHLQEREIKSLVTPELYEKHLQRGIMLAESQAPNSFHCKTSDCPGWCLYEDNVNVFKCPVCAKLNCLTCSAIHEGRNCKQYQEFVAFNCDTNEEAKRTKGYLEQMLQKGEAMECPKCRIIIVKKDGCDFLTCSMCKIGICWVTKGPRWGPMGPGDNSGGCQCNYMGKKCHPKCRNCH